MTETTRKSGLLLAALAVLASGVLPSACSKDPMATGAGDPIVIQTSLSLKNANTGDQFVLTGQIFDRIFSPLPTKLDVASTNAGVARVDSVVFSEPLAQTQAYMHAVATGNADVTFSGSGLSAKTTVVVTAPGGS
jgi:hypothetical protein